MGWIDITLALIDFELDKIHSQQKYLEKEHERLLNQRKLIMCEFKRMEEKVI